MRAVVKRDSGVCDDDGGDVRQYGDTNKLAEEAGVISKKMTIDGNDV